MNIKAHCSCGASFEISSATYLLPGGARDDKGRVYLAELRAQEWLDMHKDCKRTRFGQEEAKP